MKYHITKDVGDIITHAFEQACLAGHFPKVGFGRSAGSFTCSLWDFQDRSSAFYLAAHQWIIQTTGDKLGQWTRKRSAKFLADLKAFMELPVLRPADLKDGQRVILLPIRGISDHYRVGTAYDLQLEDNIVNLKDVVEDWGYQDSYGSCYTWEIVLVKVDGFWRVFEGDDPRNERGTKEGIHAQYGELTE